MSDRITREPAYRTDNVLEVAGRLAAAQTGSARVEPTESDRLITIETGYAVQESVMQMRRRAGERIAGYKIGLTSPASQELFSTSQPIAGYIWEKTAYKQSDLICLAGMHAPMMEIEVAFIMRSALEGPGVTAEEILASTEEIAVALEIVDSRWSGGQPRLGQVIADNSNAAAIVIGPGISGPDLDLSTIQVDAQIGQHCLGGHATNVMGNPLHAVSWLVEQLSLQDKRIEAGQTILSGTMTAPTRVHPGDVIGVDIRGLGTMTVTVGHS